MTRGFWTKLALPFVRVENGKDTTPALVGEISVDGKSAAITDGKLTLEDPGAHDITLTGGASYGNGREGVLIQMAENVTVWENIILGTEALWRPNLRKREAIHRIRDLSEQLGLVVDPRAPVSSTGTLR